MVLSVLLLPPSCLSVGAVWTSAHRMDCRSELDGRSTIIEMIPFSLSDASDCLQPS